MSLGLLTDNLVELYVEGHRIRDVENPQMVANLRGTHLYVEASWMGKVWKWFYKIAACLKIFRPEFADLKERKLLAAIQYTHDLFHRHFQEALAAQTTYQKAIEERFHLRSINEGNVHEARATIKNWHAATSHWFDFIKNKESEGIKEWIDQTLIRTHAQKPFILTHAKVSDFFSNTYKMVALEGYLQGPLPVEVLLKLACDQPLDKIEKETAQAFVRKMNKLKKTFSVKDFDDILESLVDCYKKDAKENVQLNPDLATLELALTNRGCRIFLQKDKEHLLWRDTLKPKKAFIHKGRVLTLGEPIGKKENPELDRNVVFNVAEDDKIVLVFGINRAICGIKDKIAEKLSWGLKSVRPIDMDEQRRFAIMPKCQDPLKYIKWKSVCSHLTKDDLNLAMPMKKLLEWFVGQNKSPFNFSSEDLIFSAEGRIECLKATLEGPFNFNELVKYAINCANGNESIYNFISEPLKEHKYAKYYSEIVLKSLLDKPDNAGKIAQVYEIYLSDIVNQGKILQKQIIALKKKAERLLKRINGNGENSFSKEIDKAILSSYQKQNYFGILPENFEAKVLEKVRHLRA